MDRTAHGVTDYEDDSAGAVFGNAVLTRQDAGHEIQRKADLAGEAIDMADELV
ncbi:hypothetical protein [Azospirillum endophyticum]